MTIENNTSTPLLAQLAELHARLCLQSTRYDWAQVQVHLPLNVDWAAEVRRVYAGTVDAKLDSGVRSLVIAAALHRWPGLVRDWLLGLARNRGDWYRDRTEPACCAIEDAVAASMAVSPRPASASGLALIGVDVMRRVQRLWALLASPAAEHDHWLTVRCAREVSALAAELQTLKPGSDIYHLVDAARVAALAVSSVATASSVWMVPSLGAILNVVDACYQLGRLTYNLELATAQPGQTVLDSALRHAETFERAQIQRLAEMLDAVVASS